MKLKDWISDPSAPRGRSTDLARGIGAQPSLISQWAHGIRSVPVERCVAIERATAGAVTRRDLRPHDWADIWPELAANDSTGPAVAAQGV
jgi:DNA-binding transcriptional regulator YdaS (Cro superfamily)